MTSKKGSVEASLKIYIFEMTDYEHVVWKNSECLNIVSTLFVSFPIFFNKHIETICVMHNIWPSLI